jgi:hypothetical protein
MLSDFSIGFWEKVIIPHRTMHHLDELKPAAGSAIPVREHSSPLMEMLVCAMFPGRILNTLMLITNSWLRRNHKFAFILCEIVSIGSGV